MGDYKQYWGWVRKPKMRVSPRRTWYGPRRTDRVSERFTSLVRKSSRRRRLACSQRQCTGPALKLPIALIIFYGLSRFLWIFRISFGCKRFLSPAWVWCCKYGELDKSCETVTSWYKGFQEPRPQWIPKLYNAWDFCHSTSRRCL